MKVQCYLCDLPPDCDGEQVSALLQPLGAVSAIEWVPPREGSDLRRAVATLETGTAPRNVMDQLNRQCIGAQPVVVTPAAPPKKFGEMSKATRRRSQKIGRMLGETQPGPINSIAKIIHICGLRFTLRMVKQAFEIEAAGGLMLPDGSRRRTTGGVFFYQARGYLSPALHEYLFVFRKKPKKKAAPPAPQPEPPDAPQAGLPAPPEPPAVAAPPPPPEPSLDELSAARERLAALREQHRAAQAQLDAARKGQAPKTTGVFSLMKQLVDTQKAIDALLAEHPALEK